MEWEQSTVGISCKAYPRRAAMFNSEDLINTEILFEKPVNDAGTGVVGWPGTMEALVDAPVAGTGVVGWAGTMEAPVDDAPVTATGVVGWARWRHQLMMHQLLAQVLLA